MLLAFSACDFRQILILIHRALWNLLLTRRFREALNMKNQKMGVVVLRPYHPNARPPMATDYRLLEKAQGDYVKHRKNGDACLILPRDGKCTWTKGRVAGDYVYGVKESDGYYHYELRYDEGPEDKAMMEKDDWEYIQNLLREGRLLEVEPNTDKEIAWRHRYRKQIKRALKSSESWM